jgi:hypothetical protein
MDLANNEPIGQSWEDAYHKAILETDNSVLAQRIEAADRAIKARLYELSLSHHGTLEEQQAIRDALVGLDVLRKERDRLRSRVGDCAGGGATVGI